MKPRGPDSRSRIAAEALVAGLLLIVLSPLLLAIAIAVRLSSPGPVFFRQERLGAGRVPFTLVKFRTMRTDNDETIHRDYVTAVLTSEQAPHGGVDGVYKLTADPRVTRLGSILRRTSLDELPQLWNVVRGEMALVGPRPVLAWEASMFPPWAARRFDLRPGLTGLWQVKGRSRVDYQRALALDVEYRDHRSVWVDMKILLATIFVLLDVRRAR